MWSLSAPLRLSAICATLHLCIFSCVCVSVQVSDCSSSFLCVFGEKRCRPPTPRPLPSTNAALALEQPWLLWQIQPWVIGVGLIPSARLFFLFCYGNEIFHLTSSKVLKHFFVVNVAVWPVSTFLSVEVFCFSAKLRLILSFLPSPRN